MFEGTFLMNFETVRWVAKGKISDGSLEADPRPVNGGAGPLARSSSLWQITNLESIDCKAHKQTIAARCLQVLLAAAARLMRGDP